MQDVFLMSHLHLNKHLAQEGHDKRRVHAAESADGADGQLSDLKHLVVQRHKQRLQVLGLGEVGVESLIEGGQDAVANVRICGKNEVPLGSLTASNVTFHRLQSDKSSLVLSPGSVMPTTSSLLSTSATTCTAV